MENTESERSCLLRVTRYSMVRLHPFLVMPDFQNFSVFTWP